MASSRKTESAPSLQPPALLKEAWDQWLSCAPEPVPSEIVIAYSGGADSTALLHAVAQARPTETNKIVPVRAIHFHHGLNAEADAWQLHCEHRCQELGIPLRIKHLKLADASENSARQARYTQLLRESRPGQVIMTGHHLNDQSETVLLNLLRGAGLAGAGGIEKMQPFAKGWLMRPFLSVPGHTLRHWLNGLQRTWVEDPSNQQTHYRRNFLRQNIFPRLAHHWPKAAENLSRSAELARAGWELLHYFYRQHGPARGQALPLSQLQSLPSATRSTWLSLWLADNGLENPDYRQLREFLSQCLQACADKNPHLALGYYRIIRWSNALHLVDNKRDFSGWEAQWDGQKPLELPANLGRLAIQSPHEVQGYPLLVRFHRGGESILLPGHRHHKRLKKVFQEQRIPPWQRGCLPLLFDARVPERLLAVGDWLVATGAPFERVQWLRPTQSDNPDEASGNHWL